MGATSADAERFSRELRSEDNSGILIFMALININFDGMVVMKIPKIKGEPGFWIF